MPTPRRLVSLSPNISMILFALGADATVVGRTQDCVQAIQRYLTVWNVPEHTVASRLQHWQALPVVGVWPLADHAAIRLLYPEAILTSGSGPFGVHEAEALGVAPQAMYHFDTRTLTDLERHIQQIGALLGTPEAATALAQHLAHRCQAVTAQQRQRTQRPTVLFEYCVCMQYDADPQRRIAQAAQTVLVGGHAAPELIQYSGGTSLCVQPGDTARWVTFDEIQAVQPEVILQYDCHGCPTARTQPVMARQGWLTLPAVAREAVYTVHENISDPNLCCPAALEHLVGVLNRCPLYAS